MLVDSVNRLKMDIDIVEAVSIYNKESLAYIYQDRDFKFLESMVRTKCFEKTNFMYYESDDSNYFILSMKANIIIACLKKKNNYNRVLLELSCKKILSTIK